MPDILVISTVFWNKLSDQEKRWLEEAAAEATIYQRKLWQEAEQEALDAVTKAGVEIIRPDKSAFAEETRSLFDDYKNKTEMYQLIQQIQAVQ